MSDIDGSVVMGGGYSYTSTYDNETKHTAMAVQLDSRGREVWRWSVSGGGRHNQNQEVLDTILSPKDTVACFRWSCRAVRLLGVFESCDTIKMIAPITVRRKVA